jgi:hypothetical protein
LVALCRFVANQDQARRRKRSITVTDATLSTSQVSRGDQPSDWYEQYQQRFRRYHERANNTNTAAGPEH